MIVPEGSKQYFDKFDSGGNRSSQLHIIKAQHFLSSRMDDFFCLFSQYGFTWKWEEPNFFSWDERLQRRHQPSPSLISL
jgi:hypothetical protein